MLTCGKAASRQGTNHLPHPCDAASDHPARCLVRSVAREMSIPSLKVVKLGKANNKHGASGVETVPDQFVIVSQENESTIEDERTFTISIFDDEQEAQAAEQIISDNLSQTSKPAAAFRIAELLTPLPGINANVNGLKKRNLHHFTADWRSFFNGVPGGVFLISR